MRGFRDPYAGSGHTPVRGSILHPNAGFDDPYAGSGAAPVRVRGPSAVEPDILTTPARFGKGLGFRGLVITQVRQGRKAKEA